MRITIYIKKKEVVDDILAKSNLLARQMSRNPDTEELAGDIMTPDDELVKPVVARALPEAFGEVKRKCQQFLMFGRYNDDNRLEKIDETNIFSEDITSSPLTVSCKYILLTGIEHIIDVKSDVEIKVMDDESNILAKGSDISFKYTPVRINEHLTLYSPEKADVNIVYRWGDFGTYELELEMPKRFNIGMTETIKSNAHRMMVDYVMYNILKDQYAEKAQEYLKEYTSDGEALRIALISRSTYGRAYAADWT